MDEQSKKQEEGGCCTYNHNHRNAKNHIRFNRDHYDSNQFHHSVMARATERSESGGYRGLAPYIIYIKKLKK